MQARRKRRGECRPSNLPWFFHRRNNLLGEADDGLLLGGNDRLSRLGKHRCGLADGHQVGPDGNSDGRHDGLPTAVKPSDVGHHVELQRAGIVVAV